MVYFIQVIESIRVHRFVPFFRKHVKSWPQFKIKRIYFIDSFFLYQNGIIIYINKSKDNHMNYKKIVVAGGGVLGSQIAFQSAYCEYDATKMVKDAYLVTESMVEIKGEKIKI